jgi:hypothetical protein
MSNQLLDFFQIDSISIYSIFILFLIISANYLGELFPCRVQKLLSQNVYLKHIFGYLTLSFFVVLVDPYKKINIYTVFKESFILYILFLFFINTQQYFFLLSIFFLFIIYVLNLKKIEYEENMTQSSDKGDKVNKSEKQNNKQDKVKNHVISEEFNVLEKKILYINQLNRILIILFIITIIVGFLIYMGEKKLEYKNKFNYITFIFGQSNCRDKTPSIKLTQSLSAAFS